MNADIQDDGVNKIFDLIIKAINFVSLEMKREAKCFVDRGDSDSVTLLMKNGKYLDDFNYKMCNLKQEWNGTFDQSTRSRIGSELFKQKPPSLESIRLSMKYANAWAEAEYSKKETRILVGSTIRKKSQYSLPDNIRKRKEFALQDNEIVILPNSDLYEVKRVISFRSSSAAAQFVAGCSVSGPREWKVKGKNKSLASWLSNKK